MTIIKHGNPKERLRFVCPDCGCEWKARVGESKYTILGYQMICPDCGYNTNADFQNDPDIKPNGLRIRKSVIDVLSKDVKTEVNDDSP